jgi:hypothetical protein
MAIKMDDINIVSIFISIQTLEEKLSYATKKPMISYPQ